MTDNQSIQGVISKEVSDVIEHEFKRQSRKFLWVNADFYTGDAKPITDFDPFIKGIFGGDITEGDIIANLQKLTALQILENLKTSPSRNLGCIGLMMKSSAGAFFDSSVADYQRGGKLITRPFDMTYDERTKVYATRDGTLDQITLTGTSNLDIAEKLLNDHQFNKLIIDPYMVSHHEDYSYRAKNILERLPLEFRDEIFPLYAGMSFVEKHAPTIPTVMLSILHDDDRGVYTLAKTLGVKDAMRIYDIPPAEIVKRILN